jgi:hypothetical protein
VIPSLGFLHVTETYSCSKLYNNFVSNIQNYLIHLTDLTIISYPHILFLLFLYITQIMLLRCNRIYRYWWSNSTWLQLGGYLLYQSSMHFSLVKSITAYYHLFNLLIFVSLNLVTPVLFIRTKIKTNKAMFYKPSFNIILI